MRRQVRRPGQASATQARAGAQAAELLQQHPTATAGIQAILGTDAYVAQVTGGPQLVTSAQISSSPEPVPRAPALGHAGLPLLTMTTSGETFLEDRQLPPPEEVLVQEFAWLDDEGTVRSSAAASEVGNRRPNVKPSPGSEAGLHRPSIFQLRNRSNNLRATINKMRRCRLEEWAQIRHDAVSRAPAFANDLNRKELVLCCTGR